MIIKTYQKYIIKNYLLCLATILLVFVALVFILNILQEIEFFTNKGANSIYPIYLSLMNTPSIVFCLPTCSILRANSSTSKNQRDKNFSENINSANSARKIFAPHWVS